MPPERLTIEEWPIERLIPYARNPRRNDHVVDRMAAVIGEFGFRLPVLARSDGTLVDGHLRLKAAQRLGLSLRPLGLGLAESERQAAGRGRAEAGGPDKGEQLQNVQHVGRTRRR